MAVDQIGVLLLVVAALEKLSIPYVIVGSFASSAHGLARATMDIDLLTAIKLNQTEAFVAELESEFYVDDQAIRRAIQTKRHFNLIHLESMFKVDVFIATADSFREKQLERRRVEVVIDDPQRGVYIATPEDTILAKLNWYRLGNKTSDQQWRDVLGVIKVQGDKLDLEYLRHWARELKISDLLETALTVR